MKVEQLFLSSLDGLSSQTDWNIGRVVFNLPEFVRTGSRLSATSVTLQHLSFVYEVDQSKTDYCEIEHLNGVREVLALSLKDVSEPADYVSEANKRFVDLLPSLASSPPLQYFKSVDRVRLTVPTSWRSIALSPNMAANLGFNQLWHASGAKSASDFSPELSVGLAPLLLCAPGLAQPVHSTNAAHLPLLQVLGEVTPVKPKRMTLSFDGALGATSTKSALHQIAFQFCTPTFPNGVPLLPHPIFAVIRIEKTFDES